MKQYAIVIALVAVVTAGIVGFVATPVKWFDGDDHQEGHTLTYAWVDGANAVHPESAEEITWYDPSTRYKVCYNPQDPTDRKLYPAEHVCGS